MGIISSNWRQIKGAHGFPAWVKQITATNDQATMREIERHGVNGSRVKFVALPNRQELAVQATDGATIRLLDIEPNAYDFIIKNTVKILPAAKQILAHPQPAGHEYAGLEIIRVMVVYQQTLWNHVPQN